MFGLPSLEELYDERQQFMPQPPRPLGPPPAVAPAVELQGQLAQVQLSQGEALRLARLKQGMATVQEKVAANELTRDEGSELTQQIQESMHPLMNRMQQAMGLQHTTALNNMAQGAAMQAVTQNVTNQHMMATLPQRIMNIPNPHTGQPGLFFVNNQGNPTELHQGAGATAHQGQAQVQTDNLQLVHQLFQMAEQQIPPLPPNASQQHVQARNQVVNQWVQQRLGQYQGFMAPQQPGPGADLANRMLQNFPLGVANRQWVLPQGGLAGMMQGGPPGMPQGPPQGMPGPGAAPPGFPGSPQMGPPAPPGVIHNQMGGPSGGSAFPWVQGGGQGGPGGFQLPPALAGMTPQHQYQHINELINLAQVGHNYHPASGNTPASGTPPIFPRPSADAGPEAFQQWQQNTHNWVQQRLNQIGAHMQGQNPAAPPTPAVANPSTALDNLERDINAASLPVSQRTVAQNHLAWLRMITQTYGNNPLPPSVQADMEQRTQLLLQLINGPTYSPGQQQMGPPRPTGPAAPGPLPPPMYGPAMPGNFTPPG